MEARFYSKAIDKNVQCNLCPHNCTISSGKYGFCRVRQNINGTLVSKNYGKVSSLGFDPIEKKPLYHFYPGSEILSVGSLGCNLKCEFCQNWQISQTSVEDFKRGTEHITDDKIIEIANTRRNNIGIAYTYNEPTVFFEFMIDIAQKTKENNLKNVMVTNGFINQEPLRELNNFIDAYNVDLKSFDNDFYSRYTKSNLEAVKESLKTIAKAEKHLEITNLIIPELNDNENDFKNMVQWIRDNLGKETVLHISRYYPTYKLTVEATSVEKMQKLDAIAKEYLDFVFLGNVLLPEGNNSQCPDCGEILISRSGYMTLERSVSNKGDCIKCGKHVFDYFKY